jgi:hypothetical protein
MIVQETITIPARLVLIEDRQTQRLRSIFRSVLVFSGVIAFFNGILLAHVLSMFRLSVEAGTFLVIDVGRRIHPDLALACIGCRSRGCDRTLRAGYRRSSRSRRRLSSARWRCVFLGDAEGEALGLDVASCAMDDPDAMVAATYKESRNFVGCFWMDRMPEATMNELLVNGWREQ